MNKRLKILKIFKDIGKIKEIEEKEKIELLIIKLNNEGYYLEGGIIQKTLIEYKSNKQSQIELYINTEKTYYTKKKFLINLLNKLVLKKVSKSK